MNAALPRAEKFHPARRHRCRRVRAYARVAVPEERRRTVVALDDVNPVIRRYLNRLSDHLFVLGSCAERKCR